MKSSSKLFFHALPLLTVLLIGCGGSKESSVDTRLVWPGPPDTPRVAYVTTLKGEDDYSTGLKGMLNTVAGRKSVVEFQRPFDVCVGEKGKVYVTDAMQGVILYDRGQHEVIPLGEHVDVEMKDPRGIAYGHGKLFVGVANVGQIIVIDSSGTSIAKIGRPNQFKNPVDLVLDTLRSRLYVVDNRIHQVVVYTEKGDSLFSIGRRGEGDGEFNYPQSAAIDQQGNLYVVDAFNYRVEVFDTTGKFLRQFGKQGDAYGTFARPKGIAIDTYGNIYVLDGLHNNFQMFNSTGELLMFVGHFSPGNDGFQNPVSMAIDHDNTIYVTDNLNGRVQVFQLLTGGQTK